MKKCGQHSVIQSKLSQLQSAFMSMLSENDGEKLASINQIKYFHQSPVYYSEDINILCTTLKKHVFWRVKLVLKLLIWFFVDVTQDIASKGLGMIYEISSSQQKDSLVSELVETLTTGKRSVV